VSETTLTKISEDDAALMVSWRNANAKWFPGGEVTEDEHLKWYREVYALSSSDHMYMVRTDTPEAQGVRVGTIGLDVRNREVQRVLNGRPDIAPPGTMSRALQLLMSVYDYQEYNLHVLPSNHHAIQFYRRNGFKQDAFTEGMIRMTATRWLSL
jgi:hypothetical protein